MAELHLPPTLTPLFGDLPRRVDVDAATVDEAISRLDERWPGVRDRLCERGPALRRRRTAARERSSSVVPWPRNAQTATEWGSISRLIRATTRPWRRKTTA